MKKTSLGSYWKLIVCALASALVVAALAGCSPSADDETADAAADSATEAVENDASAEESPDEVGIDSSADAIFEFASDDNDADAEDGDDSATGDSDDSASGDTVMFGGVKFVIPDGWSTTIDGDDMEVVIPDDGTNVAKIVITQFPYDMTEDIEKDSVEAFMSGVVASFEGQESYEGTTKDRKIDGHYAELLDCSFVLDGEPLDSYVLTVATDDGIVSMMMASTNGSYNEQFQSIIDSVHVED